MIQRSHFISTSLGIIVLIASLWLWAAHVAQSPGHVFNDMLRNNLSTSGVTRVVSQSSAALSVDQYTQLSLGEHPQAHALTIFQQGGSRLDTEEISTVGSDYIRYQKIVLPAGAKATNVQKVVGKWAKLPPGTSLNSSLTSGLFQQSILGTLPLANLRPDASDQIMKAIYDSKVFSFDVKTVKTINLAGEKVYQYNVSINSTAYIRLMQRFEKLIGQNTFAAINPASYSKASPISVQIDIDARSHQLAQIYQVAAKRTERYEAFGITDASPLPKTSLTTTQLTQLLASS